MRNFATTSTHILEPRTRKPLRSRAFRHHPKPTHATPKEARVQAVYGALSPPTPERTVSDCLDAIIFRVGQSAEVSFFQQCTLIESCLSEELENLNRHPEPVLGGFSVVVPSFVQGTLRGVRVSKCRYCRLCYGGVSSKKAAAAVQVLYGPLLWRRYRRGHYNRSALGVAVWLGRSSS